MKIRKQAALKSKLAKAYYKAKYKGGSQRAVTRAAREYAGRYPTGADAGIRGLASGRLSAPTRRSGPQYAARKLNVPHFAQINHYYCGPASGKMILRYLRAGRSKISGQRLTQKNLANSRHMRTDRHGATTWASGNFRKGLNRWFDGTASGYYLDQDSPSPELFISHLSYSVDRGFPIAVDTVEFVKGDHYNNHPKHLRIGHWIVGRGYAKHGNRTYFLDPATSLWPEVLARFNKATRFFVNTFAQQNGMTW